MALARLGTVPRLRLRLVERVAGPLGFGVGGGPLLRAADAIGQAGGGEEAVLKVTGGRGRRAAEPEPTAVQVHAAVLQVLGKPSQVLHDVNQLHHWTQVHPPVVPTTSGAAAVSGGCGAAGL